MMTFLCFDFYFTFLLYFSPIHQFFSITMPITSRSIHFIRLPALHQQRRRYFSLLLPLPQSLSLPDSPSISRTHTLLLSPTLLLSLPLTLPPSPNPLALYQLHFFNKLLSSLHHQHQLAIPRSILRALQVIYIPTSDHTLFPVLLVPKVRKDVYFMLLLCIELDSVLYRSVIFY
jgi:hypothetical protein